MNKTLKTYSDGSEFTVAHAVVAVTAGVVLTGLTLLVSDAVKQTKNRIQNRRQRNAERGDTQ